MEERRRATDLCEIHSKQLHDLCVTVYGNGDVESRDKSLVGLVSKNSLILRAILAIVLIGLIPTMTLFWHGSRLASIVETNTKKWAALEPEHQEIIKDLEVLKEKSYGYRGIKVVTDGQLNRV